MSDDAERLNSLHDRLLQLHLEQMKQVSDQVRLPVGDRFAESAVYRDSYLCGLVPIIREKVYGALRANAEHRYRELRRELRDLLAMCDGLLERIGRIKG